MTDLTYDQLKSLADAAHERHKRYAQEQQQARALAEMRSSMLNLLSDLESSHREHARTLFDLQRTREDAALMAWFLTRAHGSARDEWKLATRSDWPMYELAKLGRYVGYGDYQRGYLHADYTKYLRPDSFLGDKYDGPWKLAAKLGLPLPDGVKAPNQT